MIIFFGLPISCYNTTTEGQMLGFFASAIPKDVIVSLNHPRHQDALNRLGNKYLMMVLSFCEAGIFLPFQDGYWDCFTASQANWLHGHGKEIMVADRSGRLVLLQHGINGALILSAEETAKRFQTHHG